MQRRWVFQGNAGIESVAFIRKELKVPRFIAEMLVRRGFSDSIQAEAHLRPKLRALNPPEAIPGMLAAADRILKALRLRERIVIYGDYDVDGTTSLAILCRIFRAYGANVPCFLPLRAVEGYGLSEAGIARCRELHDPQLLIAVDCGTTSISEINHLRADGVDVVVLDHHEPLPQLPDCSALVNPKCGQDFHYLCSAGIVFKLAHTMVKISPVDGLDLRDFLDLVAMATVADIVPLVEDNRIFVRHGLERMAYTRWPGVEALMKISGVELPIQVSDVGFRLGPRINAAGRLGSASEALQLLLTDDPLEAARLAAILDSHNRERQTVERHVVAEAENWVRGNHNPETDISIIAASRDWHIGVIGVVASRIMRQYHRPTFIIGFDSDGVGKGSGRSIEGLSLVSLLRDCEPHLQKFGGHEMAAGISISEGSLPSFRQAFESAARRLATPQMLSPSLHLDAELPLADVDTDLLEALDLMEPFGTENAKPVLFSCGVTPLATPRVLKEKHLRIEFAAGRRRVAAVFFNAPVNDLPRPPWDVAFTLEWNLWQGRAEPQVRIVEIRHSE